MAKKEGITKSVQKGIDKTPEEFRGGYSDGYHTFEELYEFLKVYNAALFNEWAKIITINPRWESEDNQPLDIVKYDVHKSKKHFDGKKCFGGGWFIVVAQLPTGQITNHYKLEDWDLFKIPEYEHAKYEFDGHTTEEVIKRIKKAQKL